MGKVQTNFNNFIPGTGSRSSGHVTEAYPNVGTADIAFGAPVFYKAAAKGVVGYGDAAATADNFLGFCHREASKTPDEYESSTAVIKPGELCDVMTYGAICVEIVSAATVGAPVYLDANGKVTGSSSNTMACANTVFRTVAYPKAEIVITKRRM